jgi:FixJ family two-component response regulator
MGGDELAEQLRHQRPGLRVLFMSAYSDSPHVRQDVCDGTADHLQKPFAPAVLADKTRELLDR